MRCWASSQLLVRPMTASNGPTSPRMALPINPAACSKSMPAERAKPKTERRSSTETLALSVSRMMIAIARFASLPRNPYSVAISVKRGLSRASVSSAAFPRPPTIRFVEATVWRNTLDRWMIVLMTTAKPKPPMPKTAMPLFKPANDLERPAV